MKGLFFALLMGLTALAGCSVAGDSLPTKEPPTPASSTREIPTSIPPDPPEITARPREVITLSISLYLLVDDLEEPNSAISTQRTEDNLRNILEGMNAIWSQADVELDLQTIETVAVPEGILRGMQAGNLEPFFREIDQSVELPQTGIINGFYLRSVGGPNGINPFQSRAFFVIDEPSVFDRRVSSHEVGHILGLHHVLDDAGRLLFSGTNGMTLTEEEATVARYFAQGILRKVR